MVETTGESQAAAEAIETIQNSEDLSDQFCSDECLKTRSEFTIRAATITAPLLFICFFEMLIVIYETGGVPLLPAALFITSFGIIHLAQRYNTLIKSLTGFNECRRVKAIAAISSAIGVYITHYVLDVPCTPLALSIALFSIACAWVVLTGLSYNRAAELVYDSVDS